MQWNVEDTKQKDLLEAGGQYNARVVESEERMSKKGNPYINMKLQLFVDSNTTLNMYCSITPAYFTTLRDFCLSSGLYQQLASHSLTAIDCRNRDCVVVLTKEKNDKGYYEVKGFFVTDEQEAAYVEAKKKLIHQPVPEDDDIPF